MVVGRLGVEAVFVLFYEFVGMSLVLGVLSRSLFFYLVVRVVDIGK